MDHMVGYLLSNIILGDNIGVLPLNFAYVESKVLIAKISPQKIFMIVLVEEVMRSHSSSCHTDRR